MEEAGCWLLAAVLILNDVCQQHFLRYIIIIYRGGDIVTAATSALWHTAPALTPVSIYLLCSTDLLQLVRPGPLLYVAIAVTAPQPGIIAGTRTAVWPCPLSRYFPRRQADKKKASGKQAKQADNIQAQAKLGNKQAILASYAMIF